MKGNFGRSFIRRKKIANQPVNYISMKNDFLKKQILDSILKPWKQMIKIRCISNNILFVKICEQINIMIK